MKKLLELLYIKARVTLRERIDKRGASVPGRGSVGWGCSLCSFVSTFSFPFTVISLYHGCVPGATLFSFIFSWFGARRHRGGVAVGRLSFTCHHRWPDPIRRNVLRTTPRPLARMFNVAAGRGHKPRRLACNRRYPDRFRPWNYAPARSSHTPIVAWCRAACNGFRNYFSIPLLYSGF